MSLFNKPSFKQNFKGRTSQSQSQYLIRTLALTIMIGVAFLIALTSLGAAVQSKMAWSSETLRSWTSHIAVDTFKGTLSMEIPQLGTYNQQQRIETPQASRVLFEMITTFNPQDPRSLIRHEVPWFAHFDGQLVVAGQGVNYTDFPMESNIPLEEIMKDREAVVPEEEAKSTEEETPPSMTTEGRNVVFIYHTHNTESWLSYLPSINDSNLAHHPEVNITKVGERLGQELEKRGIGTYVDTTNFAQQLKDMGLSYADSYDKSRETVQEVMAQEQEITFVFDLHRDALGREQTTIDINGESYARTFFVIGGRNKNYEKNQAFAERFHNKLEEAYPGLSKGVFLKQGGHGEYNQSLGENNILIEIGGVENTLEESYRSAEALADVIADLYWDAHKVDTQSENESSAEDI